MTIKQIYVNLPRPTAFLGTTYKYGLLGIDVEYSVLMDLCYIKGVWEGLNLTKEELLILSLLPTINSMVTYLQQHPDYLKLTNYGVNAE